MTDLTDFVIQQLAWLKLLVEPGPPGPKLVPHGRPVKETNKQTKFVSTKHLQQLGAII